MTVGEVLAAKQGGPPVQYQKTMHQPTPKELVEECNRVLAEDKEVETDGEGKVEDKPVFGPERLPGMKK
jgi:hypothetical protein